MSGRVLSASELVRSRCEAGAPELPQGGGVKADFPDGSWLQKKKLDLFNEERKNVLEEERIRVKGSLTTGEWHSDLNKAKLTSKPYHQFWKVMGHYSDGSQWLLPEEALFLMDEGVLQIFHEGTPWTIQQAYMTILGSSICLEHYQVYSHLCRLGYIVQRHNPMDCSTDYERKLGLDKPRGKKRKTQDNEQFSKKYKDSSPQRQHMLANLDDQSNCDSNEKLAPCSSNEANISSSHVENVGEGFLPSCQKWYPSLTEWDARSQSQSSSPIHTRPLSTVKFPNIAEEETNTINLQAPEASLLPRGIDLSEREYTYHCGPRRKYEQEDNALDYSVTQCQDKTPVKNWQQWRKERLSNISDPGLHGTLAETLWRGDVTPLIKPSEAVSNAAVLSKLSIIKEVQLKDRFPGQLESQSLDAVYDVFLPNANFKKSSSGLPNIRVCVTRQEEMAPSLSSLLFLHHKCSDGVPLQWAVVDNGDIAFYSFNGVELPVHTSSF